MLRDLFNAATGRTPESDPLTTGLRVTCGRWGRRTVRYPGLPELLEARRRRALALGLDAVDRALMDPGTVEALRATAARMAAAHAASRAGPADRVAVRV
jgi:hypothetical protein